MLTLLWKYTYVVMIPNSRHLFTIFFNIFLEFFCGGLHNISSDL